MYEIVKRGIKLGNEGVSNDTLDVYMFLKNDNNFRLVLKPLIGSHKRSLEARR